jgi:hypothetical protein
MTMVPPGVAFEPDRIELRPNAPAQATDPVNPHHYKSHPSGVECIDIVEHHDFCTGNAIKYLWRAGQKGDELEDLEKALWYLARRVDRLREERGLASRAG